MTLPFVVAAVLLRNILTSLGLWKRFVLLSKHSIRFGFFFLISPAASKVSKVKFLIYVSDPNKESFHSLKYLKH